jgi:thiamine biosynthesis protein ThiI
MTHVLLCRFGELFLKLGNRSRFEEILARNVRRAVAGVPSARVETPHGRVLVHVDAADLDEACARVARVFGLVSFSPAVAVPAELDRITEAAVACARASLEKHPERRRSFRVEARRSDKRFPQSSQEVAVHVGAAVNVATSVPVNLKDPALVVGVEVGQGRAFVYTETIAAPGGLPVSSSGKALLLLSGGIDSPAAAWLAAKRGLALEALYFHSPPFVGEKSKDKVVSLAKVLARWGILSALHVANFTETQKRLREAGPPELAVVLYRRMMLRVADRLASDLKAQALVTGENLGQVASQTVTNMRTIETASRHLILRPLLTYDKSETVALARRIGTYDISALPYDDCCSLFVPPHPATGARVVDAERVEARLDVAAEVDGVVAGLERIDLG